MLGSLILVPKRHTFNDGEGHGCAIGMANAAVGFKNPISQMHSGFRGQMEWCTCIQRHPWIERLMKDCPHKECSHGLDVVAHLITHLFDAHEWSPAEIADWVRTIEPQEPAPTNTQTHTVITQDAAETLAELADTPSTVSVRIAS